MNKKKIAKKMSNRIDKNQKHWENSADRQYYSEVEAPFHERSSREEQDRRESYND